MGKNIFFNLKKKKKALTSSFYFSLRVFFFPFSISVGITNSLVCNSSFAPMQRISMQIEFRQKIPSAVETEETTRECTLGCGPRHNAINAYLHTGVARS